MKKATTECILNLWVKLKIVMGLSILPFANSVILYFCLNLPFCICSILKYSMADLKQIGAEVVYTGSEGSLFLSSAPHQLASDSIYFHSRNFRNLIYDRIDTQDSEVHKLSEEFSQLSIISVTGVNACHKLL